MSAHLIKNKRTSVRVSERKRGKKEGTPTSMEGRWPGDRILQFFLLRPEVLSSVRHTESRLSLYIAGELILLLRGFHFCLLPRGCSVIHWTPEFISTTIVGESGAPLNMRVSVCSARNLYMNIYVSHHLQDRKARFHPGKLAIPGIICVSIEDSRKKDFTSTSPSSLCRHPYTT